MVLLTFFIPYGISVAASVMIGNALGKGWSKSARKTTEVVYYLVVAVEIFAALFLILLRDYIPLIFTDEPEVIEYATLLYNVREWLALFGNSKFVFIFTEWLPLFSRLRLGISCLMGSLQSQEVSCEVAESRKLEPSAISWDTLSLDFLRAHAWPS